MNFCNSVMFMVSDLNQKLGYLDTVAKFITRFKIQVNVETDENLATCSLFSKIAYCNGDSTLAIFH